MMKERRLLMDWSWLKSADFRKPINVSLRVEVDEPGVDDTVVLVVDLTPEQVAALLSGSIIHTDGRVGT